MPVYAKLTEVTNPRFHNRATVIMTTNETTRIPVPDSLVICNGCNKNIAEEEAPKDETPAGYLVYLGKRELQQDRPYDIYCGGCLKDYFPKAVMVDG